LEAASLPLTRGKGKIKIIGMGGSPSLRAYTRKGVRM
jgi:hypothetical protein